MLVLSRKKNEKVFLYEGEKLVAEVTVAAICGNKVKLGITAAKRITIDREEIFESKRMDADEMKRATAQRVATKEEGKT